MAEPKIPREPGARVVATAGAARMVERLREKHGPLILHQSGGCCEGSAAMCLTAAELPASAADVELGRIGGAPFVIDRELYERWGRPRFLIDVADGAAEGFSLEGGEGVHFVSRAPSGSREGAGDVQAHTRRV